MSLFRRSSPWRRIQLYGGSFTRAGSLQAPHVAIGSPAQTEMVPSLIVKQSLASLDRAPAQAIGNLRDILDGRPSELETEVGAAVRLARTAEVDVPGHEFLY